MGSKHFWKNILVSSDASAEGPGRHLEHNKAKLQKEGIFFLIHLFARDILLMKRLEIEETKTT